MSADAQKTIARLRPFWGRIVLFESPMDETELPGGLVLPHGYEGDGGVKRGVVQSVDKIHGEPVESAVDLEPGTPVWYRNGVKILDVVVVERRDILAYEEG